MKRFFSILVLLLILAASAWATPTLTLTADKTSASAGVPVQWTITATSPAAEAKNWDNLTIRFKPASPFILTEAIGPLIISNQATVTWDGGSALSNIASLRVTGQTVSVPLVAGEAVIPVGTIEPGGSVAVTVKGGW
jgi:hypothetical protein